MGDHTVAVTDATFDETIKADSKAVLVDFWAEWCGPCKMIAPALDEIAAEHGDALTVAKLDIEANPVVTQRFEVRSIPTLIVFVDGEPKKRFMGAKGKAQLLEELAEFL